MPLAILEIHWLRTIKKNRPKQQNGPKQNHIWMGSHKHTSLHLSGHTKNSIIARSVALAKVSTENAFKCG